MDFRWKVEQVFHNFCFQGKKTVLEFWWKSSTRRSELHSICTEDQFGSKNFLKKCCFYLFGTYRGNWIDCCWAVLCTVDKTAFSVTTANFRLVFEYLSTFSSTPISEIKPYTLLLHTFRHSCENCILASQTNEQKIGFPQKSVTLFHQFRFLRKKNESEVWWQSTERLSELRFTCTEDHFGKKTSFIKKILCLYFQDLEGKIIWLFLTFFLHCWENCVFRRQWTFWHCFEHLSFFPSTPRFEFKNSTLLAQTFR